MIRRHNQVATSGRCRLAAAVVSLSSIGCATSRQSATTIEDSAGVIIATSPGIDLPAPWRLEPIASIGGAESGAENLDRLAEETVGADTLGRVYVISEADAQVIVFDSAGHHLTTLGRRRGGPGEVQTAGTLYVDPTGRAFIQDYGKSAIVQFLADGTTGREASLASIVDRLYGGIRLVGDTLLVHGELPTTRPRREALWAMAPSDTVTLATIDQMASIGELHACNYRMRGLTRTFAAQMNWTSGGGMVVVNSTATYQLDLFKANRLVRRIRRNVPLAPANGAMIKRLYPTGRMYGGPECIVSAEQIEREVGAADNVPAIRGVAIDLSGRVWVGRFSFPDEAPRTDVFSPEGNYLGTFVGLTVPLAFPSRDLLVTPVVDSVTDIARLEVARFRPPGPS